MNFDETLELSSLLSVSAWWRNEMAKRESIFHLMLDAAPGYAVTAGLTPLIEMLEDIHLDASTVDHLAAQKDQNGQPLFDDEFLAELESFSFTGDLHAMPEGTLAFPGEPILRIKAPLMQAELLRRLITDFISHSTSVATQVSQIRVAAKGDRIEDADIVSGANVFSSRAAYLGGAAATNRVSASRRHGIPLSGQLTTDWLPSFGDVTSAFSAGAAGLPSGAILPVHAQYAAEDVKAIVAVAKEVLAEGAGLGGIRLFGKPLVSSSRLLRTALNRAGLKDLSILSVGSFTPDMIRSMKKDSAKVDAWALHHMQPAATTVSWRMGAIRDIEGRWQISSRASHEPGGELQVVRKFKNGKIVNDTVTDQITATKGTKGLLASIFSKGNLYYFPPSLDDMRTQSMVAVDQLGNKQTVEVKLDLDLQKRTKRSNEQMDLENLA